MNGADVGVREWPETLVNPDRTKIAAPFRWRRWIVCTNGHMAAAIPDDGREAGPCGYESAEVALAPMDADPPADALTLDMDALREWCGLAAEPCPDCDGRASAPCEECDGEGYVACECWDCGDEHETACPECDGEGAGCWTCKGRGEITYHGRHDRIGYIGQTEFNRRALAYLLNGAPGASVQVVVADKEPPRPITLYGDGWRAMLMPLRQLRDALPEDPDEEVRHIEEAALATPSDQP